MQVLVDRGDVLYSWVIPYLGLKIVAVFGRLNQLGVEINSVDVFTDNTQKFVGESGVILIVLSFRHQRLGR